MHLGHKFSLYHMCGFCGVLGEVLGLFMVGWSREGGSRGGGEGGGREQDFEVNRFSKMTSLSGSLKR